MKIYWSFKTIPEMEGVPKEEAERILKLAVKKTRLHWRLYLACVVGGLVAGVMAVLFAMIGDSIIYPALGGGIGGMLGAILGNQILAPVVRSNVREILVSSHESNRPAQDA